MKAQNPHSCPDDAEEMRRAMVLVSRVTFHNEQIITHRFPLEEINKAFATLENKPRNYIKGIVEI